MLVIRITMIRNDEELYWQKYIESFVMPLFRFAERKKYEKGATRRATQETRRRQFELIFISHNTFSSKRWMRKEKER